MPSFIEHNLEERVKLAKELRSLGINPYPYSFARTETCSQVHQYFDLLSTIQRPVSVAGRVMLVRRMGGCTFLTIEDASGRLQLYLQRDKLGESYKLVDALDRGDFVGATGTVMRTKRGEDSVDTFNLELLTKSIRSVSDKRGQIQDTETRYRQRYLDLMANKEGRSVFEERAKVVKAIREVLDEEGFLEVETPLLQSAYGGADARPFVTTLKALNLRIFLSISPELYLKKLLVGGFERVYTICKNFRNEGIDRTHNPEFTMMECYAAYQDYNWVRGLVERIYARACERVNGKLQVQFGEHTLDFTPPWKTIRMVDAVNNVLGMDTLSAPKEALSSLVKKHGLEAKVDLDQQRGLVVQDLFGALIEPTLIQPTFVLDHPKETTTLCKPHRKDQRLIERFEPYVAGMEIGNAYSELNDPTLQRRLFEEQALSSKEDLPIDGDFLTAIEYGMPPTGGLGLGIDRMVMLLTNQQSIKDVILFPFVRPDGVSRLRASRIRRYYQHASAWISKMVSGATNDNHTKL